MLACATDETVPKFLFWPPPVYQDLDKHHDWPVENAILDLPIRMKGDFGRHCW